MFIELAYKAKHEFWRYIVGFVCVALAVIIGQIPWTIAVIAKEGLDVFGMGQTKMMGVLDSNLNLFLLLLYFFCGLLALFLVIRFLHQQKIKEITTTRKKMDWGRFFFAFSLVAIFTIVTTGYDYYSNPEDYVVNFELMPFLILCVIAIIMIPIQTSFEEYLFRGYLMQGFGMLAKNRWVPLVVTSIVFGGMHFWNPEVTKIGNFIMLYYIGTGFLLGIMTLMDEGMELSLGFHAGNNLVGVLLVTADWTALRTNSILKDISDPGPAMVWELLIPMLFFYVLILFIMARKYHWKNWREKLLGKLEEPTSREIETLNKN